MKRTVLLALILISFISCDKSKNNLRTGNKSFAKQEYEKAEESYLSSLQKDSAYMKANYNLGNTNYRMNNKSGLDKSLLYYDRAINGELETDSSIYQDILYNRGNTNFKLALSDSSVEKKEFANRLKKAISDYKSTLRLNPEDSAAKYNLALATHLLKQNESPQSSESEDDEQDVSDSDNNKNQENQGDNKENKSLQLGDENKKDEAERMLEALKYNEKQTLDRIKKDRDNDVQHRRTDKEW